MGRPVRPEDNGYKEYQKIEVMQFPRSVTANRAVRRAGGNVTQMHYAKKGVITPEMEYVAIRENEGREQAAEAMKGGESFGASIPKIVTPEFVMSEVARGRAIIPANINHISSWSRWRSAGISRSRSTAISATRRSRRVLQKKSRKMVWATRWGADTIMDLSTGKNIHATREWIIRNSAGADWHGANLPSARESRRHC